MNVCRYVWCRLPNRANRISCRDIKFYQHCFERVRGRHQSIRSFQCNNISKPQRLITNFIYFDGTRNQLVLMVVTLFANASILLCSHSSMWDCFGFRRNSQTQANIAQQSTAIVHNEWLLDPKLKREYKSRVRDKLE